jgi:NEDD4-binding protein 2
MNQRTLIICRGIPGSGKSFEARKLAGANGYILSTDDYYMVDGKYTFDPSKMGIAHEWNKQRARESMALGLGPIIIDNTNTVQREWYPYYQMAKDHNYFIQFVYPTSPWWLEMAPRIKDKSFTDADVQVFFEKNTHNVPFEVIRAMMTRFDFNTNII